MGYEFDWSSIFEPRLWATACGVTLSYALGTITLGIALGVICGVFLLIPNFWVTAPVRAYVQFFRCTPLLVQIVWFFYALPMVSATSLPAWAAAGIGLTLYMGAFCAEIFRGGVISIDRGQWQSSRALGMTYVQMMWHIILPQAMRRMVPPVVNQSVLQLKNTSLLYVVAVPDLMYTSAEITSRTYRPLESYTCVAAIYFALLYPMTVLSKRLETRFDR